MCGTLVSDRFIFITVYKVAFYSVVLNGWLIHLFVQMCTASTQHAWAPPLTILLRYRCMVLLTQQHKQLAAKMHVNLCLVQLHSTTDWTVSWNLSESTVKQLWFRNKIQLAIVFIRATRLDKIILCCRNEKYIHVWRYGLRRARTLQKISMTVVDVNLLLMFVRKSTCISPFRKLRCEPEQVAHMMTYISSVKGQCWLILKMRGSQQERHWGSSLLYAYYIHYMYMYMYTCTLCTHKHTHTHTVYVCVCVCVYVDWRWNQHKIEGEDELT